MGMKGLNGGVAEHGPKGLPREGMSTVSEEEEGEAGPDRVSRLPSHTASERSSSQVSIVNCLHGTSTNCLYSQFRDHLGTMHLVHIHCIPSAEVFASKHNVISGYFG